MKPYCARNGRTCHACRGERIRNNSAEPSSGGIGIRLKIASAMLKTTNRPMTSIPNPKHGGPNWEPVAVDSGRLNP